MYVHIYECHKKTYKYVGNYFFKFTYFPNYVYKSAHFREFSNSFCYVSMIRFLYSYKLNGNSLCLDIYFCVNNNNIAIPNPITACELPSWYSYIDTIARIL